jgi:phospholipase D1/2
VNRASLYNSQNTWKKSVADKARFIVDAADYYEILAESLELAEESILIVGWDISARVSLRIDEPDRYRLAELLLRLVAERPRLHVYLLGWNFPFLFLGSRELPPALNVAWKSHPRIHHGIDDFHPVGACHHQKIVVIDDKLAFSGGLDICHDRWDTPEHLPNDPRRKGISGHDYSPFHDCQLMLAGPIAKDLGDWVRYRWNLAFGQPIAVPEGCENSGRECWPAKVLPSLEKADFAISLTYPRFGPQDELRQVERMTLDLIRTARELLYIENQYLVAKQVGEALMASLQQPQGPEIVIVLPQLPINWIEESTMGVLQYRLVKKLRRADRYKRLAIVYPTVAGLAGQRITVHSKVMIVDDDFLKIGSANLNHRSMGLDTECDITLAAEGRSDAQAAIRGFRQRLLCEHLGYAEAPSLEEDLRRAGSLLALLRDREKQPRTLRPIRRKPWLLFRWLSWGKTFDPNGPMAREVLVSDFLKHDNEDWLLRGKASHQPTLSSVVWSYLLETLLTFPPLLIFAALLLFLGPIWGLVFGWLATVLCSAVQYWVGTLMPVDRIRQEVRERRLLFQRLVSLRRIPNFALRLVAMAPLSLLNLTSGAARTSFSRHLFFTSYASIPLLATVSAVSWLLSLLFQLIGALLNA